jgi:hypothetical protein
MNSMLAMLLVFPCLIVMFLPFEWSRWELNQLTFFLDTLDGVLFAGGSCTFLNLSKVLRLMVLKVIDFNA